MGARPIAILNALRFGSPDHPQDPAPGRRRGRRHRRLRQLRRRADRRRRGQFPPAYNGNILVNAMCVGHGPTRTRSSIRPPPASAIPVVYVGSKTGRDGIHGATMASAEFGDGLRGEAPDRAGRRSVHREAADRGLPRADGDRRHRRDPGHGRRRASPPPRSRWPARAARHRARPRHGAAARDGHDAPTRSCCRRARSAC